MNPLEYLMGQGNFAGVVNKPLVKQIGELANLKNRKVVLWRVLLGRDEVPNEKPAVRHLRSLVRWAAAGPA